MKKVFEILLVVAMSSGVTANVSKADFVSGSYQTYVSKVDFPPGGEAGTVNLTTLGSLDWRQFAQPDYKKGGGDIISDYTSSEGSYTFGNSLYTTTWTDGTNSPNGSVMTGLGHNGGSYSFNAVASSSEERKLTVIVGGYQSKVNITAQVGSVSYSNTYDGGSSYYSQIYTFDYLASNPSENLNFSISVISGNHVDLIAAAVSPTATPEPSSYVLMALGIFCLAAGYGYRRRMSVVAA